MTWLTPWFDDVGFTLIRWLGVRPDMITWVSTSFDDLCFDLGLAWFDDVGSPWFDGVGSLRFDDLGFAQFWWLVFRTDLVTWVSPWLGDLDFALAVVVYRALSLKNQSWYNPLWLTGHKAPTNKQTNYREPSNPP